jgi:uncharacterized protein (TIGR03437 family)
VRTIPVTLTVTSAGAFSASPTSLGINYQIGDPLPDPRTVSLTLTGGGAPLAFTASATSAGNWLAVRPGTGSVPATLNIQASPAGLSAGSYTGTIQIVSFGLPARIVSVSLNVYSPQNLTLSPGSLAFSYQIGGPAPAAQNITVGCAGSALSFRPVASSVGNWLVSTVPNGLNNNQIVVSINPAGLAAGSYSGVITIFGVGACNTSQNVPVTLLVGAAAALTSNADSLLFSYQAGAAPPAPQSVSIDCGGALLPFRATASSSGGWLHVSPSAGSTPAVLYISVDPTGLAAGSYAGSASVSVTGACAGNRTISVSLVVGGLQAVTASALTFSAASLSFTYSGGASPAPQTISLTCTGPQAPFTAAATSNGSWLSTSPGNGTTPGTLSVSVNPTGLTPGSYTGSISATAGACGTATPVAVTLTVASSTPAPVLTLTPASLSFNYQTGGANPGVQTLAVSGSAGLAFSAISNSANGWLSVTPLSGTAPTVLSIAANPAGLPVGTYTGTIYIRANSAGSSGSQNASVTLTVSAGAPPASVTSPLAFTYVPGGPLPAPQPLLVADLPAGTAFTVAASSPENWLSASPSSATSPATLSVSVNPAALAKGTYSGAITITPAGGSVTAQTVPVTLEVTSAVPFIGSLVNAASLLASPLAPGEIVSIFGRGLGPVDSALLRITPASLVDNSLAGTRVIIDGKAAPLLYTQSGQVNTIIPYSVAGRTTIQMQLEYQGVRSDPSSFSVAEAAPAIFTLDGSGRGPGAILNQDTSINSDSNPLDRGSIAVLYATGAGLMLPASDDGAITGATLARPVASAGVNVDGLDARITYAGAAPGLVAGVIQVNFQIPPQVRTGPAVPVLLKIGRFTSQSGVTLSIR